MPSMFTNYSKHSNYFLSQALLSKFALTEQNIRGSFPLQGDEFYHFDLIQPCIFCPILFKVTY